MGHNGVRLLGTFCILRPSAEVSPEKHAAFSTPWQLASTCQISCRTAWPAPAFRLRLSSVRRVRAFCFCDQVQACTREGGVWPRARERLSRCGGATAGSTRVAHLERKKSRMLRVKISTVLCTRGLLLPPSTAPIQAGQNRYTGPRSAALHRANRLTRRRLESSCFSFCVS